jgi:hypothetical protein
MLHRSIILLEVMGYKLHNSVPFLREALEYDISSSHGVDYKKYYLLGYDAV